MKTTILISITFLLSITSKAQAPDWQWAKSFGSAVQMFDERGESVAVDGSGNVYTVGEFTGTVDFDQGAGTSNITSFGYFDVFISKLDAAGNFLWAKHLGGTSNDDDYAVTIDPTGNYIYVTGNFGGTADFDPGANTYNMSAAGSLDIFVCKLDVSGNFIWARQMEGSSTNYSFATGIVTDNSGNVYTTGYFSGTVDFDPGNGVFDLSSTTSDIFFSKLDASGNFIWAKQIGGTSDDRAYSICLDHSGAGDFYVTGFFGGTFDFDPGNGATYLTSAGQRDIFITRFNAAGNFVWAKSMGGTLSDWGNEITLDVNGNIWLTGGFYGTADFDPGPNIYNLTSNGMDDIFTAELNPNGSLLRVMSAGSQSWDEGFSITADSIGNIFSTGFFTGSVDFNPDSAASYNLNSIVDSDIFVCKMNTSGNLLWATSAGGTKGETGLSIAVHYNEDVYVAGYYRSSSVDFSAITITNADIGGSLVSDAFVAKLDHVTGVPGIEHAQEILIYPNPADGRFNISFSGKYKNAKVTILNALGEILLSEKLTENKLQQLDLTGLRPGIYFLSVKNNSENAGEIRKLVIE